jgi:hypothetical protein
MELKDIVKALNEYYKSKYPNADGWFIGRVMIEPQAIKLYKKCTIELYYHKEKSNELFISIQNTDRTIQGEEDKLKARTLTLFITELLNRKEDIDNYGIQ